MTDLAAQFRALHRPGDPVVLPNVWDAASAKAVVDAGFPAVATGSAALVGALGYEDGEQAPVAEVLAAITRITRVVAVPVTADLERGYRLPPAELVARLAETGAVGCNLEDSEPTTGELVDPDAQADLLAGVRAAAREQGVDLVVNARVDSFLHGAGEPAQRLDDALDRAARYLAAGADCVYPIFATDPEILRALVAGVDGPVNAMVRAGSPTPAELAALGIARVSYGPGVYRRTYGHLADVLTEIRGALPE